MMESIATEVMGCESSSSLWQALETLFGAHSCVKMDEYRTKIQTARKGAMSMADYLRQKRQWADVLALAGDPYLEKQLVSNILSGLDIEYLPIVLQVEARVSTTWQELQDTLLSFDSKLDRLTTLSGATKNLNLSSPSANLVATKPSGFPGNRGGHSGHASPGNRGSSNNQKGGRGPGRFRGRGGGRSNNSKPTCQVCGRYGHSAAYCYNRYDENYMGLDPSAGSSGLSGKGSQNGNNSGASAFVATPEMVEDGAWYVDSGASSHITADTNNMNQKSDYNGEETLTVGNEFQHSCPHTSAQNGRAERKHRHIVEMGLTLLAQAHMPLKFWWDSFQAAVYLINRLPTPVLKNHSPFKVVHEQPVCVSVPIWSSLFQSHKHKQPALSNSEVSVTPAASSQVPGEDIPDSNDQNQQDRIDKPYNSSQEPVPLAPSHRMITQAKAGIFKPKVYVGQSQWNCDNEEPTSVEEALRHKGWNGAILKATLVTWKFRNSKADSSLFFYKIPGLVIMVLIYVDDIIVTGNNSTKLNQFIDKLHAEFALKDLGPLHYFLGIEVHRDETGLYLNQGKYVKELLTRTEMLHLKPSSTPMTEPYWRPSYLTHTRPDLSFPVNKLSQFLQAPTSAHWTAAKRVLRYLKGTMYHRLHIKVLDRLAITGYSDADWACCPDDRRSVVGYCVYLGDTLVSWSSKKQVVVSRSSTESEYRALAQVSAEIAWIQALLKEFDFPLHYTPITWCDNMGASSLAANPVYHARTKHIELDVHFVRDKVLNKLLEVRYVPSSDQIADCLTKSLTNHRFHFLVDKLGVVETPPSLR
uniref:Reverse transcriptase Ty1/copia-type domain-containing protein n=1 Tax=Cannabis sativa TaxID=3483 RepID=A0A803PQB9_CANSA